MPRRNTEGMDVALIFGTKPAHLDQDPTAQQIQQASRRQRVGEETLLGHKLVRLVTPDMPGPSDDN